MSIKNFFTSYFDSLSDKKTRYHFNNELRTKIIEDKYFNFYKGKKHFSAVILQVDFERPTEGSTKTADGFLIAKVRPIDIHDFIIPEPCENAALATLSEVKERIDLHPTAYSSFKSSELLVQVGQIVECYFEKQGPQFQGKGRGLRFRKSMTFGQASAQKYKCIEKFSKDFAEKATAAFHSASPKRNFTPKEIDPDSSSWKFTKDEVDAMISSGENPSDWDIKNFKLKTFASKGDGSLLLHKETGRAIDRVATRVKVEIPSRSVKIKSAYRDPQKNEDAGGVSDSQHLYGRAFDVYTTSWSKKERIKFMGICHDEGFRAFGIGAGTMHIDTRKSYNHWGYKGGKWCSPIGNGCGTFHDSETNEWTYIYPKEFPWKQ